MSLSSRYVIAPSLQEYFVDKITGAPLSNGKVYFYIDGTNVPKTAYTLSGSAGNYTYVALPNPVTLSNVGTMQDGNGNDIIVYFLPFVDTTSTTIQLYQIQVYDQNGVLQFTRNGWPNFTSDVVTADQDVTNYVPNGQFLLHNNPQSGVTLANQQSGAQTKTSVAYGGSIGTLDVYNIAPGGWTFEKATGSTSADTVTFSSVAPTDSPTNNPTFICTVSTVASSGVKDLCIKFPGVNTFASDNQTYTFYFEANAPSAITNASVIVRKFFGTGGSASTETPPPPTSFDIPTGAYVKKSIPILFGTNIGKTIGTAGDDFVQIVIRLPLSTTQTASFTNFCLVVNNVTIALFPTQTENTQTSSATSGVLPIPSPTGSNYYLPIVMTPTGFGYDTASLGRIEAAGNASNFTSSICTNGNLLLCDGSMYIAANYSPLGIPYSRLQAYYMSGGASNVPQYGTGANFATTYIQVGAQQKIFFPLNKTGSQTAPSVGTSGFSAPTLFVSGATSINYAAYTDGSDIVTAIGTVAGTVTANVAKSAGGSALNIVALKQYNTSTGYYAFQVTTDTAANLAHPGNPGFYIQFSNTTTQYYIWFKFTNETDPAPGGTGIQLSPDSTMTAADVAKLVAATISAYQTYEFTCNAASAIISGTYWQFTANGVTYSVWYNKDSAGPTPSLPGTTLIEVKIATGDANTAVATKTQLALNSYSFAVPDLRGLFLRGSDTTGEWDLDYVKRYSFANTITDGNAGTFELDLFGKHQHNNTIVTPAGSLGGGPAPFPYFAVTSSPVAGDSFIVNISPEGGTETRPVNSSVVWAVRY